MSGPSVVGRCPLLYCSAPPTPKTMARMRMGRARLTLAAVLLAVAGVSEAADDAGRAVPEARVRHAPAERPLAHGRAVRVRRRPRDRAGEPDARVPEALPSGGAPGGAVLVLAGVAELRRRSRVV